MTDFLAEKRKEIDGRLRDLRPLVDEYERLEQASTALAAVGNGAGASGRRQSGRQAAEPRTSGRASKGRRRTTGRRGRPKGSGARSIQVLELVRARPGITIGELAGAMKIKANYLYRVLPALQKEKKVVKRGGGWHPA